MSKILIFSDAHIASHKHSTDRLQHCLDALDWVFQIAEDRNIDDLVFCGDLFHDRQKIDVLTYQKTFEVFEKRMLKRNMRMFLLLGNHDLWNYSKWDISSVFPLRNIPGVIVIDQPTTIKICDTDISFLPYTKNPSIDLAKINNKSKYKILFGHIAVDGAIWNTMYGTTAEVSVEHDGDMVKVGPDIFAGWDRVFLGHYHAEQKLSSNAEYVGSTLQLSYGEAFQHKHVIIFDLETHDREYIRNTFSPQHFIIPEKDLDKYEMKNNFIRIMVDDISKSNIVEMRNDIISKNAGSVEIKSAIRKEENNENLIEDAKSILSQKTEMLEKYVLIEEKRNKLDGLEKSKLLEIGRFICDTKIE